jgi:hypothetical protein
MPPKSHDISARLEAINKRAKEIHKRTEELKTKQKLYLGETITRVGIEKLLDSNELSGAQIDAKNRLEADPGLRHYWRQLNEEFFRPQSRSGNGSERTSKSSDGRQGNGAVDRANGTKPARAAEPPQSPVDLFRGDKEE